MNGKAKCKILREIRRRIAEENDISLITKDCTFQGECRGTCPKCEAELRFLEQQLERRRKLGKTVTLAALAATLSLSLTACGTPAAKDTDFYASAESAAKRREKRDKEPEVIMGEIEETGIVPNIIEVEEGEVEAVPGEPVEQPLEGDVAYYPEDDPENDACTDEAPEADAEGNE